MLPGFLNHSSFVPFVGVREMQLRRFGQTLPVRSTTRVAPQPPAVSSHSANTHLIPASGRIASALAHVRRGDVVRLEGDLVDVAGPDGFVWKTSLSRTDTGPGACETLYVRAVTIGLRRYR